MRYEDENIWLTQKMMATLYDVSVPAINQHLKRIFTDNELTREATVKQYLIVQTEGSREVLREVEHYSLQAIIAVGFKIENERAVQFRKWANQIVKDYTIQGWTMDVERLKRGGNLTDEFFERQLEKIREIRLSERKFYQKITDIYATALDYDPTATATKRFFAAVQNKMHYAIHGQTAAEVIANRADHRRENMGLTHWEGAPHGKIHRYDVSIAKNYLSEFELAQMQRIVSAYLDMAELQAMRKIPMTMEDWEKRLSGFLKLWDREILQDAGKVSAELLKRVGAVRTGPVGCLTEPGIVCFPAVSRLRAGNTRTKIFQGREALRGRRRSSGRPCPNRADTRLFLENTLRLAENIVLDRTRFTLGQCAVGTTQCRFG
jgi:hypothetical protein